MNCAKCGKEVPEGSTVCSDCTQKESEFTKEKILEECKKLFAKPDQKEYAEETVSTKSRSLYILLAIFFGAFGVHNLYAGYFGRFLAEAILTVILTSFIVLCALISMLGLPCCFCMPIIIVAWIPPILDMIFVTHDAQGHKLS